MSSDRTSELKPLNIALLTSRTPEARMKTRLASFLRTVLSRPVTGWWPAASCRMTSTWSGP